MKKLQLSLAEITEISRERGPADVCYLKLKSGYLNTLVGPFSRCLFLVHGENIGPIAQYILASENSTKYLSDLYLSDSIRRKVLSIDHTGECKEAIVKKIKVKRMPYILLEAKCKEIDSDPCNSYKPSDVNMFIQDSEGSRLVNENGRPVSVNELDKGSKVLVYIGLHGYGRHFGMGVEDIRLIEI